MTKEDTALVFVADTRSDETCGTSCSQDLRNTEVKNPNSPSATSPA